jgi:hypothetical protein
MKTTTRIPFFSLAYSVAAVLALFALVALHGEQAREVVRAWVTAQPLGIRIAVRLALLPAIACMIDILGRLGASLAFDHDRSASPRKPAILRIVIIAVHIVAIPLVVALAPRAFLYAEAWNVALITATLFVPLAIAIADLRKAATDETIS